MTINEHQKKLIGQIKEPINNVDDALQRMYQIVDLLSLMVEDNTIEKAAKETLLNLIKTDIEIQAAIRKEALRKEIIKKEALLKIIQTDKDIQEAIRKQVKEAEIQKDIYDDNNG